MNTTTHGPETRAIFSGGRSGWLGRRSALRMAVSQMRPALVALLFFARVTVSMGAYSVADDLPNPPAHLTLIPAGSWIIPMDTNLQALVAPFNLKAYGLANQALQNQTPIMWAIKAGKAKDGVDFTASASRLFPSTTVTNSLNFAGGPFIIHRDFVNSVSNSVRTFALANNVAVYVLRQDTTIDIRYTLDFKPLVGINTVNASIHSTYLVAAGITNYALVPDTTTLLGVCYTLFCEPHNSSSAGVSNVHAYVQSGGNFLAECLSVATYENHTNGHYQTTLGIAENNLNAVLSYPNSDLPFSQFIGDLDGSIGGSHTDWSLGASSVWTNRGHAHAFAATATNTLQATASKEITNGAGGMVFYLGGHSYATSPLNELNGIRMFLNAVFVPISRPIVCGVMLSADLAVAKSGPTNVWASTNFTYTITVTNLGPSPAVSLVVTDSLPAGVTFVGASAGGGLAGNQVLWTNLGNLLVGATTNLTLTVTAPANGGSLTNRASAGSDISDFNPTNSTSGPIITTVMPVADVTISKSGPAASVLPGANFDYTISITNLGPSTASGLSVTDSFPANVTFVSATPSATLNGRIVTWTNLGNLAAGASTNLTLTVAAPLRGSVTNVASGGSGTLDPNPTNNAAPPVATIISNLPPVAGNDSASIPKNIGLTISPLGNDSDPNNDPLTITSVSPTNGTVTIQGGTNVLFTPAANFIGTATIGYLIDDGAGGTAFGLITVTVTNRPPVANDDAVTTPEDTAITFNPRGNDTDADGDAITITLATATNGTVTIVGGTNLVFTPAPDFSGTETVAYQISDGSGGTASAIVSVTVTPVNDAPVTTGQIVTTPEDTARNLLLTATDVDSTNLTFAILNAPTNGVLSLFNPVTGTLTYTPSTNYHGPDFFFYTVSDGSLLATGTVAITVTPVNDGPVALNQSRTTPEDTATNLVLTASDVDNTNLVFTILSGPTNGTLSNLDTNSGAMTYTPSTNYSGNDTIIFTVFDGSLLSTGTVVITVTPVNDGPLANDQNATTPEDTLLPIVLTGSDVDGPLTNFTIVTLPTHGTLTGSGANVTYRPATNYNGPDSFTFTVNDGSLTSAVATVSITIVPVNDMPSANNQSITTPEETALPITLTGFDIDGPVTNFTVVTLPAHGTLTGSGANITYLPATDYNGPDSFTFTVNDGSLTSAVATVSITVTPVNDAPLANTQTVTTAEDTALPIVLTGSDVDGPVTNFTIVTLPTHGTLTGSGANLTYLPATNYNGLDAFTFTVNDGSLTSSVATVSITVTPVNDAPVALNDSSSTPRNVPVTIQPLLNDLDVDGDALNIIGAAPTNGVVSIVGGTNLLFTPASNFVGVATIGYTINDGNGGTATALVTVTVTLGTNTPPVAANDSVTTPEDTPQTIAPLGNDFDADGDLLAITGATATNGTVTVLGGTNLVFTPATNFNGTATINYTISDGQGGTASAMVTVTVTPVNDVPLANNQSVSTPEDAPLPIILTGSDVDGPLTNFTIVTLPTHGTLTGSGANVTYSPATNYNGPDSFTFTVNDASLTSAVATVSITVTPVNDTPLADNQSATTPEDTALPITLTGSDVDGPVTNFTIVTLPIHGTLTGSGANVTYLPATNYYGPDSFSFTVNDGSLTSAVATVSITVTPLNDGPAAFSQSVITPEDTATNLVLIATDVDNTNLVFAILNAPTNGLLSGFNTNTGALTYTPNGNYNGPDFFRFTVSDGSLLSTGTVSITVVPVNDGPVANNQSVTTPEDTALPIVLTGSDVDGPLTNFTIVTLPTHGTLAGSGANLTYQPATNYNGPDSFTFTVNDGSLTSAVATVSINVTPVNDAPVAFSQSVITPEDTATNLVLTASDVDSTNLVFAILNAPTNGVLNLFNPNTGALTYTPNTNYNGPDYFTFTVSDGSLLSTGTVSIAVTPVNDAPVAVNQSVITPEDTTTNLVLTASDVDSTNLVFAILNAPTNGVLSLFNPNTGALTYTPNTNYHGPDFFRFTVSDGTLLSTGTVSITVTPVNDAPLADSQSVTTPEDTALPITLTGSDVDGPSTNFVLVTLPTNGTLSGSGANLTYTPATNYTGTDSFTFTVNDGSLTSAVATVSINVTPVNDAPVAFSQSLTNGNSFPLLITLTGTDVDGPVTNFTVLTLPGGGPLTGTAPTLTFTPTNQFAGVVTFTFTVHDGALTSAVATVTITITNSTPATADLAVMKTGPAGGLAGADLTYAVTITNFGANTATNVIVQDQLPVGFTFVSATPAAASVVNNLVSWSPFNLASGRASNFTVTARAAQGGAYTNVASGTSDTPDPLPGNNTATNGGGRVTTTITPQADVAVSKSGPAGVTAGANFSYTISITNLGPSTASNVVAVDNLPASVTFVSASGGGTLGGGNVVTWPATTLAANTVTNFTVTVTAPSSGQFTNTASASSPTGDPNPTNNVGTNASAQVTTTVGVLADVAVTVNGPSTVLAGASYTYVVSVTNFGPSVATNVLATNALPAGVTFVSTTGGGSQSGGNVTWPAITLPSGAGTSFTITVTAPPSGVLTNRASGSSLTPDPDLSNNNGSASGAIVVTTVTPQADLAVSKTGPATVLAGASFSYSIIVSNFGPSIASNVVAQDFLPASATFVSANLGGTLGASNIVTWPARTILSGASVLFTVTVSAPANGVLTNRASATSPVGDPNPGNNNGTNTESVVTTGVTPQADVVATIDGPATVLAGATYTCTVFVTNLGPTTATNVFTTNLLPATVTFVSANSGGTLFLGRVFWPAVTLPVGAGTSYTATVTAPAEGVLTARGQGGSRTPDPDLGNNTGFNLGGFVDTTVIPQADVAVSKFGPSSVLAGANYNYNIVVTNLGPSTASNVVASDNLPASVTFVSATASGTLGTNNLVTWPATTILSGDSAIFTVTVTAPAEGAYTNTASATSPTGDPNPGNNTGTNASSQVSTTVTPQADVAVGKSGPATVLAGANFTYTISVTNFGPSTASNVAVVDHLPRGVTFVSANSGGFNDFGNVNWTVPAMLSGAVTNFTVTLTAPASGTFTNHTSATSPTGDPNPGNNAVTNGSGQVVTTVTPQADIAVGKSGPATVLAGANVTYTISVTNLGPSTASNVVAVDTLPANATFVSASGGGSLGGGNVVTWPAMTLLSGATATFTVTVTAPASGSLFNTASASSPTSDPNPGNNSGTNGSSQVSTAITPLADIVVTVSGPTNALAGSNITYTITITNFGPSIATNAFVTNTLPGGVTFVSANGGGTQTNGVVTWPVIPTLGAGQGTNFIVIVTVPGSGVLTNSAGGGSLTSDPNLANNNASSPGGIATTTITPQADVVVGKSGPATATAGSNFVFTISITNLGPSTASNVVAVDTLPATVTFVSASGGGTLGGGNVVTWPATTLAANARTNFTVTVTSVAVGTITNRASATSPTGDPNPGNNSGTNTGGRVVTTVVSGVQFGFLAGPAVFNPQTGLFEERVTVTNIGFTTIAAARLYVSNLSTNATFSNPSGVSGGIPYAQYNAPLNPGQTVVFTLEFLVPNRRPFTNTLTLEAVLPAAAGTNSGAGGINISRAFVDARPPNAPRFVIEFPSTVGRVYTILYRDSLSSPWKVATPSVTAGANRTQWYDDGPPKTDGPPLTNGSRYYRVIEAPVNQ